MFDVKFEKLLPLITRQNCMLPSNVHGPSTNHWPETSTSNEVLRVVMIFSKLYLFVFLSACKARIFPPRLRSAYAFWPIFSVIKHLILGLHEILEALYLGLKCHSLLFIFYEVSITVLWMYAVAPKIKLKSVLESKNEKITDSKVFNCTSFSLAISNFYHVWIFSYNAQV